MGPVPNCQPTCILPFRNAAPVANLRIKKVAVHPRQRFSLAKEMPGPGDGRLHGCQIQRFGRHIDRGMRAQDAAKHVVINDIGLERRPHQTGLRTRRLRDDIGPCLQRQRDCQAFFITGLRIRDLAVSCAGYGGIRQAIELGHRHGGRCQLCLLTAAARHRAGPQICYHRAWSENGRAAWRRQMNKHHTGKRFCRGLRHTPGNSHRAGRTQLAKGVHHRRNAAFGRPDQHTRSLAVKPHGRHSMIDIERDERRCAKRRL